MNKAIEKVTAFITRERNGLKELLVFKHPTTGIQIPAGTVEEGEGLETAVRREVEEETGLQIVNVEKYLGYVENELKDTERIIAKTAKVYIEASLNATSYEEKLTRELTVDYHAISEDFTRISYIEYNKFPQPASILYNITGWVQSQNLSAQKTRHFFQLSTQEKTKDAWQLKSDKDHIFEPYWTPLKPKPQVVEPQSKWLDFVYKRIST